MPLTYRTFIMGLEDSRHLKSLELPSTMPREWHQPAKPAATRAAQSRKNESDPTAGRRRLTVRLLKASAGAGTTELLGLAATGVRHQEGTVVGEQDVLDLLLGGLVDV